MKRGRALPFLSGKFLERICLALAVLHRSLFGLERVEIVSGHVGTPYFLVVVGLGGPRVNMEVLVRRRFAFFLLC